MSNPSHMGHSQHVTSLTTREWITMFVLLLGVGGLLAYSSLYQAFKTGQFVTGALMSVAICYPLIIMVTRRTPWRAIHLTNHLQTSVSAAGSSVGMGSMLVAYQWTGGGEFSWWHIALIAVTSTLFGIFVANLFAENIINKKKLSFPTGLSLGVMLRGMSAGGKALQMIGLGITIAIPLFVWESPIAASMIGVGWICGFEIVAWAMATALVCQYFEPQLKTAGFIENQYREFTLYIGASMIFAAGFIDMLFSFFAKKGEVDNPDFTERPGFLKKGLNWGLVLMLAAAVAAVLNLVFGIGFALALACAALIIPMVYVGLVCLGKTDLAPISVLSGSVILFATTFMPKTQALIVGAMAGQANSNGLDAGQDFRSGERVGSHLPLQRTWQLIGGAVGAGIMLVAMYTLFTKTHAEALVYETVKAGKSEFDCGFALKYYGFLNLREKLGGVVGTACLWTLGIVAAIQIIKNVLAAKGLTKLSRFIPSAYACSSATILGFDTTKQQFYGGLIVAAFFTLWHLRGTATPIAGEESTTTERKTEPMLWRIPWHTLVGIPGGLLIGESMLSFLDSTFILFDIKGTFVHPIAKITVSILAMFAVGIMSYKVAEHFKRNSTTPVVAPEDKEARAA